MARADDLFGTAVGIAVEGLQQRRHVDRPERRNGDRDRAAAGQEIGEKIARKW